MFLQGLDLLQISDLTKGYNSFQWDIQSIHRMIFPPKHISLYTVQVPKFVWQPAPQYALVAPHQPEALQQFPKVEPWHVLFTNSQPLSSHLHVHLGTGNTYNPAVPPHVASVLTFFVALGVAAADVFVELTPTPLQVPNADWQPIPQ